MQGRLIIAALCGLFVWRLAAGGEAPAGPPVPDIPPEAWGAPSGGLRVAAWAPGGVFPQGQGYVAVGLKNVSGDRMWPDRWRVVDRMSDGEQEMPLTRGGRQLRDMDPTHPGFVWRTGTLLEPGEAIVHVGEVGLLWDLSVGREYTYELAYQLRDPETGELLHEAKAPPVRFTTTGLPFEQLLLMARYSSQHRQHGIRAAGERVRAGIDALEYMARADPEVHIRFQAERELERIRNAVDAALAQELEAAEPAVDADPEREPGPRMPLD